MHQRTGMVERVDPDETKLCEVHKHSFGIIAVYIQSAVGMIVAIGLIFFLLPLLLGDEELAFMLGGLFAAVAVFMVFGIVLISTYIYRQNRLIVTDRNITQVLQSGLFSRKVSQLNIMNVEDVTVVQDGLIPTSFNFGKLSIETAGEQSNFHFDFCPSPSYYAKIILDAREKMLGQMDNDIPHHDPHVHPARQKRSHDHKEDHKKSGHKPKNDQPKSKGKSSVRHLGAEVVENAMKNNY